MGIRREELEAVTKVLESSHRGMTITDVTERLQINRNSVAKYLDMLLMAGKVEMKTFGRSKIYRLSRRISLATALSLSSDLIVFIDERLTVIDINDQFLKFAGLERSQVLGRNICDLNIDLLLHRDILLNLRDALRGVEYIREIHVQRGKEDQYFMSKLIPIASNDLQCQMAVVFENITARKMAELALKASEARYRAVVEDQTELICRLLPDTTVLFVNGAWCKFFRRKKDDLIGKKITGFIPVQYHEYLFSHMQNAKDRKSIVPFEQRMVYPSGEEQWLHWTCRGIADDRGTVAEYQLVGRDITEQKKAEIALRESEENFRITFDRSPIGAAIVGLDFRFRRVNGELCRITGYSEKELLALSYPDITHPDDLDTCIQYSREAIGGKRDHYQIDKRYLRKDGRTIWVRLTVRLIKNRAGEPLYFLPLIEDITEKKNMEESLRLAQFSMDNATDTITWIDESGRMIYVNNDMCEKLGYSREELLSMTVWDVDPVFRKEVWAEHWEKVKAKKNVKIESIHRAKDGTDIPVEISVNYLCLGDMEYHCAYARDISGLKQTQAGTK